MPAPDIIRQLVQRFEEHREAYRSGRYNETQLRREFLDPFFEALGWDIFNKQGLAEPYKDVIHEDSLLIEGENKAPDYAFRIGGARKFFVEAKKPAVNIEFNIHPAFQLRRYAWSAKLPLGILTDFEEFAIYDCRVKPDKGDKASVGRVKLLSYKDYVEKWDEIAAVFSREAVLQGSFDSYAEGIKTKKGTTEVDDAFLAEIERWRELLAKNIALRNPSLNVRELNYAVQMTIDRIVFLRICEDRGIEHDEQLKDIASGKDIYAGLCRLFQHADARYNSGLFHFRDEKDQSSPIDSLTLSLKIDDKALQDILKNLYYPESPYVFREIPSDILGQVYERFLGKVIRLTAGHQAKVEEKPEVRKAGGVYYTPTFIVENIIQNTVGKLLDGRTPKEVARLKFLDPACGSGTFPLGAFQYLLDWHLKWYLEHEPEKWAAGKNPAIYQTKDGYRLTTSKKKEILLNNIFAVDIDPQAVKVTKLSLLLKVLEGESNETIGSQLALFQERVLPDLGRNIKCGNSLIGYDYFDGRMFVEQEERQRVNVFDWKAEFPQVFAQGGFDAVFGNPPYIRIQILQETSSINVDYYKKIYKAASKGNYDIYVVFVEKALSLLNQNGRLGFILPHKFFNAKYGEPLRGVIANGKHLAKVVHFGDQQVFENATTYTCLMFLDKTGHDEFEFEKVDNLASWRNNGESTIGELPSKTATTAEWNFTVGSGSELFDKLVDFPTKLGDIASIFVGLQTSADTVFLFKDSELPNSSTVTLHSKELDADVEVETKMMKHVIRSGEIGRYWADPTAVVIFPYEKDREHNFRLISEARMKSEFPKTWNYLLDNKKLLSEREHGKFKETGWYQLYPKNLDTWEQSKIMMPYMITRLSAFYDENNYYFVNVTTGGFGLTIDNTVGSQKYITGLLNSKLLDWFMKKVSTTFHGGYFAANKQFLVQLPIRPINFSDPADKARHDNMVSLVERMLALHKRNPRMPQEQEMVKREIESTDRQIDTLVYELYGLTEDETKIVEGK